MNESQRILDEAKAESDRDGAQLGQLLEAYRPLLNRLAREQIGHKLRMRISESDLVQETLLTATQCFTDFRGTTVDEFRSWLLKIFRTRLSDSLRRHLIAERRRISQQEQGSVSSCLDNSLTPSSQAVVDEQIVKLLDSILLLDPQDQSILLMRYVEQLGFEEIAERLELSLTTVWRRWSRAIDELRLRVPE